MLEKQYQGASFEYEYIHTRQGVITRTLITARNVSDENLAQVLHQARVQSPKASTVYTDWHLKTQTAIEILDKFNQQNVMHKLIYVCFSDISTYFGASLQEKSGIPMQESELAGLKPRSGIKFIPITNIYNFPDHEMDLLTSLLDLYKSIGHDHIMILPQEFKSVESMRKLVGETALSRDHLYLYDVVYDAITDIQSGNKAKVKEMLNMAKELGMTDERAKEFAGALYIM